MTEYSAGSFMRVPPSLTNSAETPSALPSWLTRAMNAGGKLYSAPAQQTDLFHGLHLLLLDGDQMMASALCPEHRPPSIRLIFSADERTRANAAANRLIGLSHGWRRRAVFPPPRVSSANFRTTALRSPVSVWLERCSVPR